MVLSQGAEVPVPFCLLSRFCMGSVHPPSGGVRAPSQYSTGYPALGSGLRFVPWGSLHGERTKPRTCPPAIVGTEGFSGEGPW